MNKYVIRYTAELKVSKANSVKECAMALYSLRGVEL